MELGPCASSSFEPCQTRKGAALRGNTASAAGRLGSMAGSFFFRIPMFHLKHQDTKGTKISPSNFNLPFDYPSCMFDHLESIPTIQIGISENQEIT